MVLIPGGSFLMGSPEAEPDRSDNEGPQHKVTVPPFFMGRYPITQAQWRAVAALPQIKREPRPDPSRFKGDNRPVEQVNWYDAVEFCARLSAHTGRAYRLPTEAEWEYACRAGTTTPFAVGETITTEVANYDGNYTYNNGPKGEDRRETTNPNVMGGKPCIRGLRVTVGAVVGLLAAGRTIDRIFQAYPYLEREDIYEALSYAAWRADEAEVPLASA
jgi:formylglycine-generating enzyme required for sulfatase activity